MRCDTCAKKKRLAFEVKFGRLQDGTLLWHSVSARSLTFKENSADFPDGTLLCHSIKCVLVDLWR